MWAREHRWGKNNHTPGQIGTTTNFFRHQLGSKFAWPSSLVSLVNPLYCSAQWLFLHPLHHLCSMLSRWPCFPHRELPASCPHTCKLTCIHINSFHLPSSYRGRSIRFLFKTYFSTCALGHTSSPSWTLLNSSPSVLLNLCHLPFHCFLVIRIPAYFQLLHLKRQTTKTQQKLLLWSHFLATVFCLSTP